MYYIQKVLLAFIELVSTVSGQQIAVYADTPERLTEVVQLEEGDHGLRAHAVSPGVVDTDMQALIRATPADRFPAVARFRARKDEGRFNTPGHVARHLLAIAFDPAVRPQGTVLRIPDE